MSIATQEDFLSKLDNIQYRTFVLPNLKLQVKYQRLDVIEQSIKDEIPQFIANQIIGSMKTAIVGGSTDEVDITKKDMEELVVKATAMWDKLVVEPKLDIADIVRIPSSDRIAWFVNAVAEAQEADTQGGGVTDAAKVANFPEKRGLTKNSKRTSDS